VRCRIPNPALSDLLSRVKLISRQYRDLTGRPLGCTGEIAELEAASILGLELAQVRQTGYDAIRNTPEGQQRIQIKGRCILPGSKLSQRLGRIDITKPWDAVMLVLLDENLDATAVYEASRDAVITVLKAPGSKSRNERGALGISKFKSIGQLIWSR
jgi:hypothetical protein